MKHHLLLLCILVYVAYPFSTCRRCLASAANNAGGLLRSQVLHPMEGTTYGRAVCQRKNGPIDINYCLSHTRLNVRGGSLDEVTLGQHDSSQQVKQHHEKYGILARLTFSYASKLMELAKTKRPLESSDTLHVPGEIEMDSSVPELSKIYNELRAEAMTNASKRGRNVVKAGESPLVLAKVNTAT